MVKDEQHFAILLSPERQHGGAMWKKYLARNEPMPIAVVIGADPHSHIAAMSPIEHGICEGEIAGALQGQGIREGLAEVSQYRFFHPPRGDGSYLPPLLYH